MSTDWYRKKTWTKSDQQDFFVRLKRSRRQFHKAQYLRVQACELKETGRVDNLHAAINLLQLLFAEYPEPVEFAISYQLLGECHEQLGIFDVAIQSYRSALSQQRTYPNVQTNSHISLAVLVAKQRRRADYDEALQALNEWGRLGEFPVMDFYLCAARAMICADTEQRDDAITWARRALEAAAKTHSGYRYHTTLGLVGDQHAELVDRMRGIAAS